MNVKARISYLTSPRRGVFVLKYQAQDSDEEVAVEISKGQLRGILVTGADLALREWDGRAE
jgi:hypothetical protein